MGEKYVKFNQKEHSVIKAIINNAKKGYLFLKKEVFQYEYVWVYTDGVEQKYLVLDISNSDFPHLCGLSYSRGKKRLGKDIVDNRVDWDKIKVKKDGNTKNKLSVISDIDKLFTLDVKIEEGSTGLNLQYGKLLKTRSNLLGLACDPHTDCKYIAQSLLNLKVKKKSMNRNRQPRVYDVICVARKHLYEKEIEIVDSNDLVFDKESVDFSNIFSKK